MRIGQRLLLLRKEKAMSQTELAQKSGLANGTICDIEKGRLTPSLKSLKRLAAALGVSAAALIDARTPSDTNDTTACPMKTVDKRR